MDCRTARETLPLIDRPDLEPEEREQLEEHLRSCPGCRAEAEETAPAIEALRGEYDALGDETPSPTEVLGMLEGRRMAPRRRGIVRLAAAAAVVAAAVLGWRLFLPSEPGFPTVAEIGFPPPPLLERSSPEWDRAERRVAIIVEGETVTARYDDEAGEHVRALTPESGLPDPVGTSALLVARPEEPWGNVRRAIHAIRGVADAELYLGGGQRSGGIGALPFLVGRPYELRRLGDAAMPIDLGAEENESAFTDVRVVRTADGVRIRWRVPLRFEDASGEWLGDATLPPEESAHGGCPELDGLRSRLGSGRFQSPEGPRCLVLFEVGDAVRYADVLRVVECAGGDPEVLFRAERGTRLAPWMPRPADEADAEVLEETVRPGPPLYAVVKANGRLQVQTREIALAELPWPSEPGGRVVVLAYAAAPWRACRELIATAWSRGLAVDLAFEPEVAHWTRTVALAPAGKGSRVVPSTAEDVRGADVRFVAPAGATAGEVFPALLRLIRLGARGFELP